jgi:uncharacterized protein with PIN domain
MRSRRAAGNMAVAADDALDLIPRHARLVHLLNGFAKVIGLLQLPRAPSLVRLIIQLSCAIDGRKGETGRADVELLLRDRGFDIVNVTPCRRRRVSPLWPRLLSGTAKRQRLLRLCARHSDLPHLAFHHTLLFEGDDFSHTDIRPALPAAT